MTEEQRKALRHLHQEAGLLYDFLDTVLEKGFMEKTTYAHTQLFRALPRHLIDLDDAYRALRGKYD